MTGLAFVVAAALVLSRLASDPLRYPVTNVDVLGTLDYTDRGVLRERLADQLRRGFYRLDIAAVRREVETLPWVANARVSRIWPGRLAIEVEEHEPAARWNGEGLLSKRLVLFHPPQLDLDDVRHTEWAALFGALPHLSGVEGRHAELFEDQRRYGRELARFGVTVEALEEDGRRSQTLRLSNAVTVRLGYEDRERRLARFVDVYERLVAPLGGRTARFDMRYSNGFALSETGVPSGASALSSPSEPAGANDATPREPG